MARLRKQFPQMPDIRCKPREIMLGHVAAHLEVAVARHAQVGDDIDRMKVDALRREFPLQPAREGLYRRRQAGAVRAQLRIGTDLP
jgi:hypothetical protein